MSGQRKGHRAEFKAKVAVEALKGLKPAQQLAKAYGVHPMPPRPEAASCLGRVDPQGSGGKVVHFESPGRESLTENLALSRRLHR